MAFSKMRSFLYQIKRTFLKKTAFLPYKGLRKFDLILYDNAFPHPVSGFRLEEFTVLLKAFENSKIILDARAYGLLNTPKSIHQKHIDDFEIQHQLNEKLQVQKGFVNVNAKLFYCLFLNNLFDNLGWLEKFKIPFVFTLYPGGGFLIENKESDDKLKRVFSSPMFRKVIVTQKITCDYLIDNHFCNPADILYVFGGVVPQQTQQIEKFRKQKYAIDKKTFDICFCAAKYTPRGVDKGYDVFIESALELAKRSDVVRFHVIGGFDENEIDVSDLSDKIKFYGYQNFEDLRTIYNKMDVIVSPNKPFLLEKGAFDGFPLGTVVEAAFNGVVGLVTDSLKQNDTFADGEELIIITDANSIVSKILELIENPERLHRISIGGRQKFLKIYSHEMQYPSRLELLQNEIKK